jgi:hypothetical protein
MDIRIRFPLCKRHFGNRISAKLKHALTEVTKVKSILGKEIDGDYCFCQV